MLTTDNLLGPLVNDGDFCVYAAVYIYLGCMYVIFGIIQIGLGASVFGYFDNVKLGAWWVGVIIVLAAFLWHRVYLSYLTACIAAATALIGTILDGISSVHFRSITACASQHNDASEILYYGSPDHYSLAMTCLKKASDIVSDGCYCVSLKSRSCNEYTLSNFRVGVNDDCGTIMTTYSMTMTASCIFCVFCFILALSRIFATYYNQNPRKEISG